MTSGTSLFSDGTVVWISGLGRRYESPASSNSRPPMWDWEAIEVGPPVPVNAAQPQSLELASVAILATDDKPLF